MRGDRPQDQLSYRTEQTFTPHARGSTRYHGGEDRRRRVYPACAGIDPFLCVAGRTRLCLPRMRGDRPYFELVPEAQRLFTPHARGSTCLGGNIEGLRIVYPACAGIDLGLLHQLLDQ